MKGLIKILNIIKELNAMNQNNKFSLLNDNPFNRNLEYENYNYENKPNNIKPIDPRTIENYYPTIQRELIAFDKNSNDPCRQNLNLGDIEALIAQLKSNMNNLDSGGKEKMAMLLRLEDDASKQKLSEMQQRINYFLKLREGLLNKQIDDPNIILKEIEYIPTFTSESLPLKHHIDLLNQNIKSIQDAENNKLDRDNDLEGLHSMPLSQYANNTGDQNLMSEFENLNKNPRIAIPIMKDGGWGTNHSRNTE